MTALDVSRFDPEPEDRRRYLNAIARRNRAYLDYMAASQLLEGAHSRYAGAELAPFIKNVNQCQQEWEHAIRDLVRERFRYHAARSAPQPAVPAVTEGRSGPPDIGNTEREHRRPITVEENEGYIVTVDDDEWTNREGMPEFNGSFRA
jgi:hypothetical protein